jgi:glycosyltransferase involved in cell wall biosynthesis
MFEAVRGMLFNSPGEATLARRLYRIPEERMHLAGEGINLGWQGDAARFRQKYGLRDSTHLLLSISRRDVTKNLPLLLSYAREYWACRATDLRLVLIGPPAPNPVFVPDNLGDLVLDLGFVPEQDKHDACAAAAVVAHPSPIESFSIALMEGWLQGAPALVYRDCEVTRDHCERSGGGLWFGSFGEFAAALDLLLPQPNLRRALGANGRNYVLQTCRWDEVARRTAKAVLSSEF